MAISDLLVGHQMGAYTSVSATDFDPLKRAKIIVINQNQLAKKQKTL